MINDSGKRMIFSSGAVRDISEGKGRCDLLPLDVIADYLGGNDFLIMIDRFVQAAGVEWLESAITIFIEHKQWSFETAMIEVSIHFEEGEAKYGDDTGTPNWQRGIPIHCYIDSAVRHYLKWRRGDTDERHDRAVLWNLMCCIWTLRHKPEMMDI